MTFKNDLFISYAHIDDEPLSEGQKGWISRFHKTLEAALSQQIGRRVAIWRDLKLDGNDDFSQEIVQQFPDTALLISVVTPRYVKSDWCTKEVAVFCETAEATGGVWIGNKSRIFKVIKNPVKDESALPDPMKRALGYPFYIVDTDDRPQQLDEMYGEEYRQKFFLKMNKLVCDVAELIDRIESEAAATPVPQASSSTDRPKVYVADCSSDRRLDREAVIADLKGYPTLPDKSLPDDEDSLIGQVREFLSTCKLSVHMIGRGYGVVPDGPSEKSISELENELAIADSKSAGLKRIIWVPSGTTSQSRKQNEFIKRLLENSDAQFGADVITGTIEDLKRAIHDALRKIEVPEITVSDKPALFIAECSFDRRDDREKVIADLRGAGYPILPEVPMPTEEASFFGALAPILGRCKLAVHIIGSNYGVVPDGPSETSVSVLANGLAAEYSKRNNLKRIIWLPRGVRTNSPRQQEFLETLRNDPETRFGADLVEGGLEELKAAIRTELKKIESPEVSQPAQPVAPLRKMVYLVFDELDREAVMPLRKFLRNQGFDHRVPAFNGDAATVRQANLDMLTTCDEVIVFYGVKEDSWKASIDAEILKAGAMRTSKPLLAPWTYLALPESQDKTDAKELADRVIDGFSRPPEAALAEFVNTVSGSPKP
jgi:hypothetical protein